MMTAWGELGMMASAQWKRPRPHRSMVCDAQQDHYPERQACNSPCNSPNTGSFRSTAYLDQRNTLYLYNRSHHQNIPRLVALAPMLAMERLGRKLAMELPPC